MRFLNRLLATGLIGLAVAFSPSAGSACSFHPYGAVDDQMEIGDDYSQTGDYLSALFAYRRALALVPNLKLDKRWRHCPETFASAAITLAERRLLYVRNKGRSPATIAAANALKPVYPKNLNCP